MAVASTVTHVSYPGNNSTSTEYPVIFPVLDGSHIKVGQRDAGGPFVQLASWAFTVVPKPGGGFAVTTTAAVVPTSTLVIWREVPVTQPTELPLAGPLPSTSLEKAHDRSTMQIQEVREEMSRTVRLDRAAGPQLPITPVPDALLGFDGNGGWAVTDAARVRELAQLDGDGSNLQATWADDAAQPSTVPSFSGQIGMRRSDNTMWVSRSTTAGDWVPTRLPYMTATNEDELAAAMASARVIIIKGPINLSGGVVVEADDLEFEGDGEDAGFVLPHNGSSQQTVCWVKARRVKFRNLSFTTNHPMTSGRAHQDIGLRLAVDDEADCSGLVVSGCRFRNLAWGILRDGQSDTVPCWGLHIDHCDFTGIYQGAIYLRWHCHNIRILNCDFAQRPDGESYDIEYNPIYIASNCNNGLVAFCNIRRFGRHGIEIWNPTNEPLAVGGNKNWQVLYNDIREPFPWTSYTPIGISVLGNGVVKQIGNTVEGCVIGIEQSAEHINKAHFITCGNYIKNAKNQGISVNGVEHSLVFGNDINRVAIDGFPGLSAAPVGIQVINGGRNVRIRNNTFTDCGKYNIWIFGKSLAITGITQAADATFTVTSIGDPTQPNGWFVGKRICLRGIGGMTGLNDKYYTITWVSGNQFRVGVDTSAMSAYTSGGRVQEDYVGLTICDNEFYVYDEINPAWSGPGDFARTVYIVDIQQAQVRCNTRFGKSTLSGYWGAISVVNYGTVYHDFAGGTITTTAAELAVGGSNQVISIFP